MSNNLNKSSVLEKIVFLIVSIVGAIFLYKYVTIGFFRMFPVDGEGNVIISTSIIVIQCILLYIMMIFIKNKELDIISKRVLWIIYFISLSYLLFGRDPGTRTIQLDLLFSIKRWSGTSRYEVLAIGNFVLFMPLVLLFKNKSFIFSVFVMAAVILTIETSQYIFSVGVFDIGDIVLNLGGFTIMKLILIIRDLSFKESKIESN